MKKGMVKLVLMLVLSCLMVLPATASPQPEEETQFNGEQIYEGEDSRFRGRPNWFDYTVVVPTNRIVPLVVRELDIKPAYEFFADIVTKRAGNQDPIVARPIMNLDVFGKLALGYESEENVRFDNPVRVELTTGFIKARTEFD
ncbi:MAG: hypothetical protein KAU31_08800, partial [Spirochaetaceae bacterium]|nr:hypothetical protein [Spirochaetaceae bacterium]